MTEGTSISIMIASRTSVLNPAAYSPPIMEPIDAPVMRWMGTPA